MIQIIKINTHSAKIIGAAELVNEFKRKDKLFTFNFSRWSLNYRSVEDNGQ